MAAPNTAYSSKNLKIPKNGGIVYNNIALPDADAQTIKERFYLDHLLNTQAGFVGMCYPNTGNYLMHNTNRLGIINVHKGDNNLKTYLDAGLNTKGVVLATSIGVANTPGNLPEIVQYAGQVAVNAYYKSAYYVATDSYGFYISINGGAYTKYTLGGGISQNSGVLNSTPYSFPSLKFGDNFLIDVFLDNAEGEYRATTGSYQVNAGFIMTAWVATYASWACAHSNGAEQITLYAKSYPITSGMQLYYDKTCELGSEWRFNRGISFNGDWFKTDDEGIVSNVGICGGSYPNDDPASIHYDTIVFRYYEIEVENGCLFAGGGNSQNLSVYQNRANQKYYSAPGFANVGGISGYVQDGYYWVSIGANAMYYVIVGGVKVGQDFCL